MCFEPHVEIGVVFVGAVARRNAKEDMPTGDRPVSFDEAAFGVREGFATANFENMRDAARAGLRRRLKLRQAIGEATVLRTPFASSAAMRASRSWSDRMRERIARMCASFEASAVSILLARASR